MQIGAGRSQTPDPFHEARKSLIRGPDRAGALAYLLMLGSLFVIPGCAVLYLARIVHETAAAPGFGAADLSA